MTIAELFTLINKLNLQESQFTLGNVEFKNSWLTAESLQTQDLELVNILSKELNQPISEWTETTKFSPVYGIFLKQL